MANRHLVFGVGDVHDLAMHFVWITLADLHLVIDCGGESEFQCAGKNHEVMGTGRYMAYDPPT